MHAHVAGRHELGFRQVHDRAADNDVVVAIAVDVATAGQRAAEGDVAGSLEVVEQGARRAREDLGVAGRDAELGALRVVVLGQAHQQIPDAVAIDVGRVGHGPTEAIAGRGAVELAQHRTARRGDDARQAGRVPEQVVAAGCADQHFGVPVLIQVVHGCHGVAVRRGRRAALDALVAGAPDGHDAARLPVPVVVHHAADDHVRELVAVDVAAARDGDPGTGR